jgi:hypothetical protein
LTDILIEPQVVYIPSPRNSQFVGRRPELEILERRIIETRVCQKSAVFGPGGIGKTQLLLKFAYLVADQHPATSVFWINAVNAEETQRHTEAIARQLRLRSAANKGVGARDLVRRYLSARAGNWLLIVDNADDTENLEPSTRSDDFLQHLPQSPLGVTIFTTRSSSTARRLAGSDSLELGEMTRDEATELLETLIVNAESLKDPLANARFLSEVGHVPRAIAEAVAYINNPKLSISDFSRVSRSTESARSSALDNRNQRAAQRRHRRSPIPYAYPAVADTPTVQYTFDGIDSSQTSSAPDGPLPSSPGAKKPTRLQRVKPCYVMVVLGFLAIGGSLAVGLYYSIAQDRMGDGFTTAGWMVAVSTLILAAPMAKHYPNRRCWDTHQYAVL